MSEYSLNSSKGKRWLPWFRDIFEEGRNLPSEHPAELLLVLASGKADARSGRFLTSHDDFDEIIGLAAKVKKNKLYLLQVDRVESGHRLFKIIATRSPRNSRSWRAAMARTSSPSIRTLPSIRA